MEKDLLIHYISGETSAEENKMVELWCREDPSNQQELDKLRKVWHLTGLGQYPNVEATAASLERFKQKAAARKAVAGAPTLKIYRWKYWMQVAAILIAIPLITWFIVIQNRQAKEMLFSTTVQTDTTSLADGSIVVLNRNSTLKYPAVFSSNKRTVSLTRGEAFFKISHDTSKPFYVMVNGIQIKVVGTAFNVKVRDGQTEVIVESGKVKVSKNNHEVLLTPQESVIVNAKDNLLHKEEHTDLLYNYYRSKEFVANGTPLFKLAAVLEEAYDVRIAFENDRIKNMQMSTTFKDESLDDILTIIAKTFRLKVNREGNQVSIKNVQ